VVDAVARPAPRPLESLASISSPRFSRPARRLNLPSPSRRSSSSRTRQHAKHTAPTPHHNGRNHHYQRSLTLRGRWDRQNRRHTARAQAGTRLLKPKEGAKTEQSRPANVRGRRDASSCASGVGVTFSGYRNPRRPGAWTQGAVPPVIYLVLLTPAAALPGLLLMDLLEQWALGQRRQARVRASRPSTPGAHVAPFHGSSRTTRATPAVAPPARAGG
jgi:hypothetical protein